MALALTNLIGFGASSGAMPSHAFTANAVNATDLTTYTFSTQAIGTAAVGRFIVVSVCLSSVASRVVSTLTVGGNSATLIGSQVSGAFSVVSLWGVRVDTGTTADVVVTGTGALLHCGIGVWALYDLLSTTPTDTGSSPDPTNPSTDTLTVLDGGIAIAITGNGSGLVTYTWTGLTENFDETVEAANLVAHSGASLNPATGSALAITATRSGAGSDYVMATASFR
jgi:hypothetical protein